MKHIFTILLLSLLLFCGAGGAAVSSFSVEVFDPSNGYSPIEGASVSLTGTESATLYTTSSGTAEFPSLKPGEYTVTVSKSGYKPQTEKITVSESNLRHTIYLIAENPVLLTVTSSDGKIVAGANVTINKKAVGKTDENGRLHASMIRGAYNTIEITAPSYIAYSENRFIDTDETSVDVMLTVSKVSPLILVYTEDKEPISGASVSVDGKLVAYTDSYGRAQLASYTAGTYAVKIEADTFAPYTNTVEFTSAASSITVTLTTASATITIKALDGSTPVSDTVIYFDGNIKGITNADGIYTTAAAPDTKIHISASHDGYTAESTTYTVQAGSDNTVVIEMKQNVPIVLIGIGILAVVIVLIIGILLIGGRKRGSKPVKSPANSYPPTNKRDSL